MNYSLNADFRAVCDRLRWQWESNHILCAVNEALAKIWGNA